MKNFLLRSLREFSGAKVRNTFILVLFAFSGPIAYAQITSTTPASRCGEGSLTVNATATSGTITWFAVPFYGTPIGTGGSYTAENLLVTTTYYVDALDGEGCSLNPGNARVPVIATISANSIQAIIFYSSNTFCKSIEGEQAVTRTGTVGGVFSVDPAGLTLNTETGAITPSTSAEGTYTVTYAVVPQEGCIENPASTTVTITQAPEQPVISYSGSPYCTTHDPVTVVRTGATGGNYSASPSGLTINATSGTITPSSSYSGTYTVTYYVPGAGGCDPMNAATTITILQLPAASISYSSPFTKNQEAQPVTLTGTGVYEGGIFSSTAGLTINSANGAITPSTSDAGTYTVTYTLESVAPCAEVFTTTSVTIYPMPTATISGSTDVCQNATEPVITFTGADGTPPYTFTYTLNDGLELNITTATGSSVTVAQPTIIAGSYEYELIGVSDATTSYQAQTGTATINVNELPVALFEYTNSPYCSNGTDPLPTFLEGAIAGIFTSTEGLVINESTGETDLSASTPGTYTVTNTIAGALGCSEVIATGPVTITQLPVATLEYTGSPYCTNETDPVPTGSGIGDGLFTSVPAGVQFVNSATGVIDLSTSTPGTYQIVNTIAAANGCEVVTATFSSITIDSPSQTPSINYSGSPYCNTITAAQPVELTGPTGGVYTALPTGLTLNSSNGEIIPSTSTPGTYTVTYTVGGNGGCEPEIATDEVIIKESPVVTNSATKTICSSTSTDIHLTSNVDNTTFAWTIGEASLDIENASAGSGDYIDQILNNTNFNTPASVAYIITPHSEVTGCDGNPFTITVTVQPAVFLLVTDPPAVCSPNTVDLTASSVTAGSASGLTFTYWNDAAATSPLVDPESVSVTGRYYIKATDGNNCYDIKPVQTVVNPLPTATISGTITVCQNDVAPLITFNGANASEPYTFTYKINGGDDLTVTTTSGNSVTVEALTNVAGTFIYTLVSVQDGSTTACNQTQTGSATITVDPTSVAGTINGSTTVCSGSNSNELSLTGQTGAVVKWQYSTDGFVSDINDISNTSATCTASDLTISTGYRVVVQSGVCPSATSAPATITVIADPVWASHSAPTPTSLCVGGSVSFSIEVTGGLGGTITWIRSETSGGTGTTVTSGDTPAAGTWYYRPHYEPTGEGCDLAGGTETTVTVNPIPDAPTGNAAQSFYIEDTHTVAELTATGSNIQWYATETSETPKLPAETLVTATHYWASQTVNNCESPARFDVTVTLNPVKNSTLGTNYPTIQDAIDDAAPGNTIVVTSGTFTEQLLIQKDLILTGAGSSTCIVKAPATGRISAPGYTGYNEDTPWNTDYLIAAYPALLGNNDPTISVKITGFTFDANGESLDFDRFTGVFFRKVNNSTIADAGLFNCDIKGFTGSSVTGVRVLDGCKLTIDHNSFENYFMGIVSYGTDNLTKPVANATYNTLNPNSGTIANDIEFRNVSAGTIGYNEIDYNGFGNSSTKIPLAIIGSQNIIADHNTISYGDVGILVDESNASTCTISNNIISNITYQGLEIEGGYHTLSGNTISYCGQYGIYLRASSNNDVLSNVISHVSTAGFFGGIGLQFSSNLNDITGNTVSFSGNNGISLDASSSNNILNNIISTCNYASFAGTVAAVNIGDAAWALAFNSGSNNNTATGNDITTSDVAIENWDGTGNVVTGNKIYGNFYGLHNYTTTNMDASGNWWDDATGPTTSQNTPSTNPCGTGNMVSINVDYSPWYTDADLTSLTGTVINTGLTVGGTGSICSGTQTDITVAASETGVSYQLRNDNANEPIGDPVTGTGSTINLPTGDLTTTTSFNVYATHATTGCSAELTETEIVTIIGCP